MEYVRSQGERVQTDLSRVVSRFHIVQLYHGVLNSGLCYERNPIVRVATQVPLKFCSGAPLIRTVPLCHPLFAALSGKATDIPLCPKYSHHFPTPCRFVFV